MTNDKRSRGTKSMMRVSSEVVLFTYVEGENVGTLLKVLMITYELNLFG